MEGAGGGRGPGWPFCPFSWRRAGGSPPRACVFRWKTQASPVGYLCEEDGEGDGGRCCERACGDNVCGGGEVGGHIAVIAQGGDVLAQAGHDRLQRGGCGQRRSEINALSGTDRLDAQDHREILVHPFKATRAVGGHRDVIFLIGRGGGAVDHRGVGEVFVLGHQRGGGDFGEQQAPGQVGARGQGGRGGGVAGRPCGPGGGGGGGGGEPGGGGGGPGTACAPLPGWGP